MTIMLKVRNMVWDEDPDLPHDIPTSFQIEVKEEDIADLLNEVEKENIVWEHRQEMVWKIIENFWPWRVSGFDYEFIAVNEEEIRNGLRM